MAHIPNNHVRVPAFVFDRERRVKLVLVIILILSTSDLALTLSHLATTGLLESNWLVRALVDQFGSGLSIVIFKSALTAAAMVVLFAFRRRWTSELAAWLGAAILVYVTIQWILYIGILADADLATLSQVARSDPDWVHL